MYDIFGYLEGVVTKIDRDEHGSELEVLAVNGRTCRASDIFNKLPNLVVGEKILLEDATVFLDNGEMIYLVDEDLRGVYIGDECDPPVQI